MGVEAKKKATKRHKTKEATTKRAQEVKEANAKTEAQRAAELFVDESGASRVVGVVLGGPGPARRLEEQELSPLLKGIETVR